MGRLREAEEIIDDGTAPIVVCSSLADVQLIGDGLAQFTLVRKVKRPGSRRDMEPDHLVAATIIAPLGAIMPAVRLMVATVAEAGIDAVERLVVN